MTLWARARWYIHPTTLAPRCYIHLRWRFIDIDHLISTNEATNINIGGPWSQNLILAFHKNQIFHLSLISDLGVFKQAAEGWHGWALGDERDNRCQSESLQVFYIILFVLFVCLCILGDERDNCCQSEGLQVLQMMSSVYIVYILYL